MKHVVKALVFVSVLFISVLQGTVLAAVDTTPPVVEHTAVTKAYAQANLVIGVKVTDQSELARVTMYFRTKGTTSYYAMNMSSVLGEYRAVIPASYATPGSIEYYIEAIDSAGNMSTWPALAAAKRPQVVVIERDNTTPEAKMILPNGVDSNQGFMAVFLLSDKANNVDPASIRVMVNGEDFTSKAEVTGDRVILQVPADAIHTRSVVEVTMADLAGNRAVRRFNVWEAVDWTREIRIDIAQGTKPSASLETAWSWGPLDLQASIHNDDPFFTKKPGQPVSEYSLDYNAKYLQLGLGDISSEQAPLAMSSLQHRGADLTLKLGPFVAQGVYGFPQQYVEGEDYARKAVGARFAFETSNLDLSANIVKIKDQWTEVIDDEMPGVDPELNYVIDTQAGVGMFGEKLSLKLETAASLYFDNAKGDLWPVLDKIKEDYENQDKLLQQLVDIADKVPVAVRPFLELPNPPLPLKLDAGAQATLRVPLPWSVLTVSGFHFGPSFYTMAGSGDRNVDGAQATFTTNRWFNLMQFSADYQQRLDNTTSLIGYVMEITEGRNPLELQQADRTQADIYNAKVSLGPAGRLNLDFTGTYREKGPQFSVDPDTITQGYSAAIRNMGFHLFGVGLRMGGSYSDMDETHLTDASADKGTVTYQADAGLDIGSLSADLGYGLKEERDAVGAAQAINPSINGSVAWTLQNPKLIFVKLNQIKLKASAAQSWTEAAGARADVQTALKGELETRLTKDLRIGGAWKSTKIVDAKPSTLISGLLRWQF